MTQHSPSTRLIMFSDDWGRHPSSSQHLVKQLLSRYPTLWVNTIGTRAPSLSFDDFRKVFKKIGQWTGISKRQSIDPLPLNLTVISPRMWPGFRTRRQRNFNAKQMANAVHAALGPRMTGQIRIAITTLPITADLLRRTAERGLDVDRWVYYCVDDFSIWPGSDGRVMDEMERELTPQCDVLIAVSETLRTRLSGITSKPISLLTHGIDLNHWRGAATDWDNEDSQSSGSLQTEPAGAKTPRDRLLGSKHALHGPIFLFWGLIDARLDAVWCLALANSGIGTLVLVGPQQAPPVGLFGHERIVWAGPMSYKELPSVAAAADVLVMPYADMPVTRAMQPLKFKEYLATGKPVVGRKLPATQEWADASDVVESAEEFLTFCRLRATEGVPAKQLDARKRLVSETWEEKARQFEAMILG